MTGILLIGLLIELGFIAGVVASPYIIQQQQSSTANLSLLNEASRTADQYFFGTLPTDQARLYASIHGLMTAFNDPYTVFVEPPATQRQSEQLSGKFGGIGAGLRREADGRFILSPYPDQPAAKAGVQEGDALINVAGQVIPASATLDTISNLLRGEVGTPVTIGVDRQARQLSFTITRAEIATPSVTWRMLSQAPDSGYIAISIFSQTTKDELVKAIEALRQQGAQRLILDLRDNGGGLLDAAIDVAGQFIDGTVVIESSRNGNQHEYSAGPTGAARDLPLRILVNHSTASASEIVAGAIQDKQRGLLVGDQTYGKGSVQNILPLSDGSSLHVTVAQWLTPNRRQITGQGLTPDVVAARTQADIDAGRDPQLDQALASFQ